MSTKLNVKLLPPQIFNQRWRMTDGAIQTTMAYIFDKLRHPCYMMGIKNRQLYFYKLYPLGGTPPDFIPLLQKHLSQLKHNPLLSKRQIQDIYREVDVKNTRVMQCIVKRFVDREAVAASAAATGQPDVDNEYFRLIAEYTADLADGIYLLNLTDANILREDGTEPFPYAYGKGRTMKDRMFVVGDFLPILGGGQRGYMDIPVPNYDEVIRLVNGATPPEYMTDWDKKRPIAVFRGGPTGCGASAETNMRLKLALMSKKIPNLLNACIVGHGARSIRYDPLYGLSKVYEPDIKDAMCADQKGLPMTAQSEFKYIIHVDGNVNAHRLLNTMLTGSLILRVKSEYIHWADHLLRAGVHYIELAEDLSNLKAVLKWCERHDDVCRVIAENGLRAARYYIRPAFIREIFVTYMNYLAEHTKVGEIMPFSATPIGATPSGDKTVKSKSVDNIEPTINAPAPSAANNQQKTKQMDFIEMPKSGRCPNGYGRVLVDGKLQCKLRTLTTKSHRKGSLLGPNAEEIPEQAANLRETIDKIRPEDYLPHQVGKRCPVGYNAIVFKGTRVCKRKGIKGGGKTRKRLRQRRGQQGCGTGFTEPAVRYNKKDVNNKELAIKIAKYFI